MPELHTDQLANCPSCGEEADHAVEGAGSNEYEYLCATDGCRVLFFVDGGS